MSDLVAENLLPHSQPMTCRGRSILLGGTLAMLGVLLLSGCGGSQPAPPDSRAAPAEPVPAESAVAEPADGESAPAAMAGNDQAAAYEGDDEGDRKWLGKIPYDVWFDDPLTVASESGSVAVNRPSEPSPAMEDTPADEPAATTDDASSAGEDEALNWEKYISASLLDEEVKRIRNSLNSTMQTVGQYNSNFKQIGMEGPTLAAMTHVAAGLPDAPTWVPNAGHLRQQSKAMVAAATGPGRSAYDATLQPFENIISLLNNNVPAGLDEDVPSQEPFAEAAARGGLMLRMDKASKWLTSNVNTADRLKSEKETARLEAAVLATLSRMIADESYDSATDEGYADYAKTMIDAAVDAQSAIEKEDFDAFSTAISKANKTCNDCHTDYRFSDDF